jgi:2-C-methyl-D-erythritol 4-phosphate cytidylyltransferase
MAIHVVIPAAGNGSRMQAEIPKQYLEIQGRKILELTLIKFINNSEISTISVSLSPDDKYGRTLIEDVSLEFARPINIVEGGNERWQSVYKAAKFLTAQGYGEEWVMVHDAVRPCVRSEDLEKLYAFAAHGEDCGAILALPVVDTLKLADADGCIQKTVDRANMWSACTPQMFRINQLIAAMENASKAGHVMTDEASALEYCGSRPKLIACHKDNIKVTYPYDLRMAELILQAQNERA